MATIFIRPCTMRLPVKQAFSAQDLCQRIRGVYTIDDLKSVYQAVAAEGRLDEGYAMHVMPEVL